MVAAQAILEVLETVDDPEMPISIVDLGMVGDIRLCDTEVGCRAEIDILPTFVGCPALPMIAREIDVKVNALSGIGGVWVRFVFDPPWSVDRISERGRVSLEAIGVTVPARPRDEKPAPVDVDGTVSCPFCSATDTHMTSAYGPTRCRTIYYCDKCHNSFEHMKRL